ncbi:MAG: serine protease [Myxococcota bacterium]|jgi:serine protease
MKSWNKFVIVALSLATAACGQSATDEGVLEGVQVRTTSDPVDVGLSLDGRYIVGYTNSKGKAALEAHGSMAIDMPGRSAAAAYLPEAAVFGLQHNPNISFVEPDGRRYPLAEVTPYGVTMVQANQVSSTPVAGSTTLCIIDSGIAASHADFAGVAMSGTNDSGTGNWSEDDCGHGTHVAGTIAAATGNGLGVASVARESVNLHIVKVFAGENCAWTYSSDLVAALDACTAAGAKVVSMSLGGSRKNNFEQNAFAAAYADGTFSIAAAGNDGNTRKSYPASYSSVMSVAAIDENGVIADFSQQNSDVEIAAPGVAVLSTYPHLNSLTVGAFAYDSNKIEGAQNGTATGNLAFGGLCDSVGSWNGAVLLCERGTVSFFDKVNNGLNGGAAAVVIFNNVPGNFAGTLGDGVTLATVALSISQEDGQALVASSLGLSGTAFSGFGDGYAFLNGTSMATPHVSAVAGLLWSQFPSATASEIRAAMNNTAVDLGVAGKDNAYGNGLVQAKAAYDMLAGTAPDCSADGNCNAACAAGADPDCTTAPDCSADGTCNAACAAGADPDCTTAPDCSADGTCNTECAAGDDPDCTTAPDCSADGTCNTECAAGDDPDCTTAPDCSADGACNAECAAGEDPDCGGGTCSAVGASCVVDTDCCLPKCKGKSGNKTCR